MVRSRRGDTAAEAKVAGPRRGPRRGEVYWVSFDPTVGAKIQKTRPALVIQNDVANRHSPITIVAAITSKIDDEPYPAEVVVRAREAGLAKDSVVLLNQIRSIDNARLRQQIGRLRPETMASVDRALAISLGLVRL
jgi:mRNA interferase MazF